MIELLDFTRTKTDDPATGRIKSALWSSIQCQTLSDASCATLDAITKDDPVFNLNHFRKSLRDCTTILVRRIRDTNVYSVRVSVNCNRLKNFIIDRIRNSIHTQTQIRKPEQKPILQFLDEINRSTENMELSFSFNTDELRVSDLSSKTHSYRQKNKWLNQFLTAAINDLENSIHFIKEDNNGKNI